LDKNSEINTLHKIKIMICEDDPALLQQIQQSIGSKYSTMTAASGRDCLSKYINERAKGNQIDILLVDYDLRDLPGDIIASTIGELRGNRKIQTHTILISTDRIDKELIDELKSKEYITGSLKKPICTDALVAVIEKVIA
jgi:CheY-like chemotaxis protein